MHPASGAYPVCHSGDMSIGHSDIEPVQGDEVSVLLAALDRQRAGLRRRCSGLSREQLNRPLPPSTMTLAGLLKHLALVESASFSEGLRDEALIPPFDEVDWDADVDWEWHTAVHDDPQVLLDLFDAAVAQSQRITAEVLAGPDGLETLARRPTRYGPPARLRWILMHAIEEYAQHNGHADLLREAIDGRTRF